MEPYTIRSILVPMDFSQVALNALETAVAISKRQLTTLTLIHVVENTFRLVAPEAGATPGSILPELIRKANEDLNELAKTLRTQHDLVVNHIVQSGNPADEICSWGHQKAVDLIVMGTHGASGLREFFMGSNAYRVVKNAPCPVMTIPGTQRWTNLKKILFPVRMIPNALDKYDVLRPIVRKNNSTLFIAGIVKERDQSGYTEMKKLVDTVRKKIDEDRVTCKSEVLYAEDVAKQVLKISAEEKPDLIVITATLDSSLKDFFLGPYTQDIVNHARFPVLSIRPQASTIRREEQPRMQQA